MVNHNLILKYQSLNVGAVAFCCWGLFDLLTDGLYKACFSQNSNIWISIL
jgi:hypothetical protein